ncbi:MAG TPA: site-specific DNA-methyltransferase [Thermoplasmata archaeon]|nr:site-specific DNA-methyltransferase [Thermoplasmata archaeon]
MADARLAGCKKGMGLTVITSDVVSSVFASRECGLLLGDAREVLRTLAEDSVDCTVTSPPYYSGRRHVGDTIHEIGSEKTVEEYVEALVSVGRELYRVTRPTGSYWLNLDDKCERKEWLGIPWRVAFAMREMGWKIRSEVIWHKPRHVRSVTKDRLTSAHEMLFHFVKSKDAYYNMDAIRKPSSPPILGKNGVVKTPRGRVPSDVWTIQIEDSTYPESPYAVFPEALVELPIRATCPRGGTVLDPFVGSGTTVVVALRLGRKAIGIDASADCLEFTKKRILEVSGQLATSRQTRLNHTVKVSHGRMR